MLTVALIPMIITVYLLVLEWEEDGEELPKSMSAVEMTAPVDGVKIPTLVLASVMWSVMVLTLVPLQPSPLMVQVIREYVVEQEDTTKDGHLVFGELLGGIKQ